MIDHTLHVLRFTQSHRVRDINLRTHNHLANDIMVDPVIIIELPLVLADSEQDMSLGWHSSPLTPE